MYIHNSVSLVQKQEMTSSIRLQYYDVTSCKQRHLRVKHYWSKEESTCYNHRKLGNVSSINKGFIAFSKKVHVFLRHPVSVGGTKAKTKGEGWSTANWLKPPSNFIAGRPKAALLFWF